MLQFSLPHTTHSSHVASCPYSPYKPAYRSVVSSLSLVNIISFIWTLGLGTRNIRLRLPNHHDIWSNYPCTHNHPHHPIFSTRLTHMFSKEKKEELTSSVQDFVKEIKKDLCVRRMESSNYSGDKWWPTHQVIKQIIIDSLIGKRDLERSREVRNVAVEMKKHRA